MTQAKSTVRPQSATALLGAPLDSSDDWPTYHRDNSRSGYDPSISQFTSVSLNWKSATLDGDVYAEPLIVGTDVIIATEQNTLYELDADTGQVVWHTNLGTPVTSGLYCSGDINPSGITGTPVIDVSSGTIFAVAFLQAPSLHHELFAVDLSTGNVKFHLTIDPQSTNFPVNAQQQRGALALANGYVYVPYGGLDGDCGPYHGWLAATSTSGTGPVLSYQVPTDRAGAIWGGGDGPAVDPSGKILVSTGNSYPNPSSKFDFGEAVLKLSPGTAIPPLNLIDWFAPSNWESLNAGDVDIGSTDPRILRSRYLFQIGKEGVGYILNANNLGHVGGQLYSADVCGGGGAYGGPAYFSPYLVVPCDNGLVSLQVNLGSSPSFTVLWRGPSYLTGPPIIAGNAVWDVDVSAGQIYAFGLTSGQTLFQDAIGSPPTHFNSVSAGDGQIFVTASRQVRAYIPPPTSAMLTTSVSMGSGSVNPNCAAPTGCSEVVGSAISVTATAASGYLFSSWTVTGAACSAGLSSNPCQFTMPSNPVTASANFLQKTNITILLSSGSVAVGSSITISGSITPNPRAAVVSISLSRDAGATWNLLMSVMTDSSGAYSATWVPPAPGSVLLEASWGGNNQYAGSQSSTASLTITGSAQPTPKVLGSVPSTVTHGQPVTISVTVFNPGNSVLNANVTVQVTGPNNYAVFDVIHLQVSAGSQATAYYDWTAPNQTGTYTLTLSLFPPTSTGVDVETIQVT